MPSPDLSRSETIGPVAPDHVPDDRAAARVLLLSRLFAAVAIATLIAWPLIETQVPNESVQLVVDLALPIVIGLAVIMVVRRVRMVLVRGEQKKRLAAEAQRQRHLLESAQSALTRAISEGKAAREDTFAEELRVAAQALGRLTGRVDVEDILDVIFRDFCIGK